MLFRSIERMKRNKAATLDAELRRTNARSKRLVTPFRRILPEYQSCGEGRLPSVQHIVKNRRPLGSLQMWLVYVNSGDDDDWCSFCESANAGNATIDSDCFSCSWLCSQQPAQGGADEEGHTNVFFYPTAITILFSSLDRFDRGPDTYGHSS